MTLEELRKYNEADNTDIEDIARAIQYQGNLDEDCTDDLVNALYQLKAMAQNSYNFDYWRTMFNALISVKQCTFEY